MNSIETVIPWYSPFLLYGVASPLDLVMGSVEETRNQQGTRHGARNTAIEHYEANFPQKTVSTAFVGFMRDAIRGTADSLKPSTYRNIFSPYPSDSRKLSEYQ